MNTQKRSSKALHRKTRKKGGERPIVSYINTYANETDRSKFESTLDVLIKQLRARTFRQASIIQISTTLKESDYNYLIGKLDKNKLIALFVKLTNTKDIQPLTHIRNNILANASKKNIQKLYKDVFQVKGNAYLLDLEKDMDNKPIFSNKNKLKNGYNNFIKHIDKETIEGMIVLEVNKTAYQKGDSVVKTDDSSIHIFKDGNKASDYHIPILNIIRNNIDPKYEAKIMSADNVSDIKQDKTRIDKFTETVFGDRTVGKVNKIVKEADVKTLMKIITKLNFDDIENIEIFEQYAIALNKTIGEKLNNRNRIIRGYIEEVLNYSDVTGYLNINKFFHMINAENLIRMILVFLKEDKDTGKKKKGGASREGHLILNSDQLDDYTVREIINKCMTYEKFGIYGYDVVSIKLNNKTEFITKKLFIQMLIEDDFITLEETEIMDAKRRKLLSKDPFFNPLFANEDIKSYAILNRIFVANDMTAKKQTGGAIIPNFIQSNRIVGYNDKDRIKYMNELCNRLNVFLDNQGQTRIFNSNLNSLEDDILVNETETNINNAITYLQTNMTLPYSAHAHFEKYTAAYKRVFELDKKSVLELFFVGIFDTSTRGYYANSTLRENMTEIKKMKTEQIIEKFRYLAKRNRLTSEKYVHVKWDKPKDMSPEQYLLEEANHKAKQLVDPNELDHMVYRLSVKDIKKIKDTNKNYKTGDKENWVNSPKYTPGKGYYVGSRVKMRHENKDAYSKWPGWKDKIGTVVKVHQETYNNIDKNTFDPTMETEKFIPMVVNTKADPKGANLELNTEIMRLIHPKHYQHIFINLKPQALTSVIRSILKSQRVRSLSAMRHKLMSGFVHKVMRNIRDRVHIYVFDFEGINRFTNPMIKSLFLDQFQTKHRFREKFVALLQNDNEKMLEYYKLYDTFIRDEAIYYFKVLAGTDTTELVDEAGKLKGIYEKLKEAHETWTYDLFSIAFQNKKEDVKNIFKKLQKIIDKARGIIDNTDVDGPITEANTLLEDATGKAKQLVTGETKSDETKSDETKTSEQIEKENQMKDLDDQRTAKLKEKELLQIQDAQEREQLRIEKLKTKPGIFQKESFQEIFRKLEEIHKKNTTKGKDQKENLKRRKMDIYKDVADMYVNAVCKKKDGTDQGGTDANECKATNDPENKDIPKDTYRKEKIFALIKALEHPSFVSYVQAQDKLISIESNESETIPEFTESSDQKTPEKKVQLKLDETRKLVVAILKKYNSENFLDFDEMLYRFFPRTFDVDFRGFSSIPDRIQKKTELSLKGHRSELEEDGKQKFGRLVPNINITYPNGFMEQILGSMLDVENFLTSYSRTGDKTREKEIDVPVVAEKLTATENQFYPGAHIGESEPEDNAPNPSKDVNIDNTSGPVTKVPS